jgi:ABC-type lipopolysaccharide export system ATPase subunit
VKGNKIITRALSTHILHGITRAAVLRVAREAHGIGVLITDHNVRETLEIVDRAYILHEGQVLMSGTPEEVVQNENVRRVYLGDNFRIS